MASALGSPVWSSTWYSSKIAWRAASICSWLRCSELISRVRVSPAPTIWVSSGVTPVASTKVSSACSATRSPAGMVILVPPSKSMPMLNPRSSIASSEITKSTNVMPYQSLRRPTKSMAPEPS